MSPINSCQSYLSVNMLPGWQQLRRKAYSATLHKREWTLPDDAVSGLLGVAFDKKKLALKGKILLARSSFGNKECT